MKEKQNEKMFITCYLKEGINKSEDNRSGIFDIYLNVSGKYWEGFSATIHNDVVDSIIKFDCIKVPDKDVEVEQNLESNSYTKAEIGIEKTSKPSILLAEHCLNEYLKQLSTKCQDTSFVKIDACTVGIKASQNLRNQYDNAVLDITNNINPKLDKRDILDKFSENVKKLDLEILQILFVHMQSAQEGKIVNYFTEDDKAVQLEHINRFDNIIKFIRKERIYYGDEGNTTSWQKMMRSLKENILEKLNDGNKLGRNRFMINGDAQLGSVCFAYQQLKFHTGRTPLLLLKALGKKTDSQEEYENLDKIVGLPLCF